MIFIVTSGTTQGPEVPLGGLLRTLVPREVRESLLLLCAILFRLAFSGFFFFFFRILNYFLFWIIHLESCFLFHGRFFFFKCLLDPLAEQLSLEVFFLFRVGFIWELLLTVVPDRPEVLLAQGVVVLVGKPFKFVDVIMLLCLLLRLVSSQKCEVFCARVVAHSTLLGVVENQEDFIRAGLAQFHGLF